MTEWAVRIPLARTRHRRPKPPMYWIMALGFVYVLAQFAVSVVKLLYEPNPATALLAAEQATGVAFFRYLMRVTDPDDTPSRAFTVLTVSLFLAGWALDLTRWCLYGFNSG